MKKMTLVGARLVASIARVINRFTLKKPIKTQTVIEKATAEITSTRKHALRLIPIVVKDMNKLIITTTKERKAIHSKYDTLIEKIEARRQKAIDGVQTVKREGLKSLEAERKDLYKELEESAEILAKLV